MKIITVISISIILLFSSNTFAEDEKKTICDVVNYCVNSTYFKAEITKLKQRGNIVIMQIAYVGKLGARHNNGDAAGNFLDAKFDKGYALLIDSNGGEYKIDGKNISDFILAKNENRVLSLVFRGNDKGLLKEPFDIFIKGSPRHGEISFFNLKN